MQTTYRLNAKELNEDIITALKSTYRDLDIEITINEVQDETAYLLSSPANRERLFTAIDDIKNNRNLVHVTLDSLE